MRLYNRDYSNRGRTCCCLPACLPATSNLNGSSLPVRIRFEDCNVSGAGIKPYGTVVSCGYYFNSFGGKGARGSITVDGGTVSRTVSFGAAVRRQSRD
eukprot:SAG22_NODE_367_length_11613_cov_11.955011_4_plen_98_part_00